MKKNIKLGTTVLSQVDTVKIESADTAGTYVAFVETSDANAVAADLLKDKTAYVNGVKIVGTGEGGGGSADLDALLEETF